MEGRRTQLRGSSREEHAIERTSGSIKKPSRTATARTGRKRGAITTTARMLAGSVETRARARRAQSADNRPYFRRITDPILSGSRRTAARSENRLMPRALRSRRATAAAMIVLGGLAGLLGGAGPAAADELVSNVAQDSLGDYQLLEKTVAQAFTTGTNASGYRLESISLLFKKGAPLIGVTGRRKTVYVYLQEDNGNNQPNLAQGGQVATLTINGMNFDGPANGLNKYQVWQYRNGCCPSPSSVHLDANTRYWVFVWAGDSGNGATVALTDSSETSAAG